VLRGITPEKAGTSKQSQGTTTKSRRLAWCVSCAPTATTKLFVQFPAQGDRAARVFYSTNQITPQNLSIKGGLLRNSQDFQFFSKMRKPATYAGSQSIIYTQIGGNE